MIDDIRKGLVAYLLDDPAILLMVGGEHIYPMRIPQGVVKDSITYQRISGLGDFHMQGPSGLSRPRIQIDCWSKSIDRSALLSDLVKERLNGFRGEMYWGEDSPDEAITVQGIFFDNERDLYDDSVGMYSLSRDYVFWFVDDKKKPPHAGGPPVEPPVEPPPPEVLPAGGVATWDGDPLMWDDVPVTWE